MNIENSTVQKLRITDIPRLDPITVYLEDFAPGQGKIIIECYGQAWSNYWGAMGNKNIVEFFISCGIHYLAGKLKGDLPEKICDHDSIVSGIRKEVISMRRQRDFTKQEARELYDECADYHSAESLSHWDGVVKVFGDDWHYRLPTRENPSYTYLCRIIKAVQEALSTLLPAKLAA